MAGLRTLVLDVPDLAAAKRFYEAAFGVPPYFDQPFYVGFDVGGYELGLRPCEGAQAAQQLTYFHADDVDAALAKLVSLGATPHEPAQDVGGGIRIGAVRDPFGHRIGFVRNPAFAPKLVAAGEGELSERSFTHEVVVKASRQQTFRCWSSEEGLRWIVPEARIELRPGGAYEWYFLLDGPVGLRGGEGCRILTYLPDELLSFTWNAPPEQRVSRQSFTWVVVRFEDAPGGGTRVRLTHTGWPKAGLATQAHWQETYAYFEAAWARVLARLQAHLGG